MRQHAAGVAMAALAQAPAVAGPGGDADLGRILNGQDMPSGDRRGGPLAPAGDNAPHGDLFIGEEASGAQFAAAGLTQMLQADCFARQHAFEDRTPLFGKARVVEGPKRVGHRDSLCVVTARQRIADARRTPGFSR